MRIKEFQQYLNQEKIDLALFILPDQTITYFTQTHQESTALLAITKHKAEFYITDLEEKPKLKNITVKNLKKGWEKNFTKVKRLGINSGSLTLATAERFKKIFPKVKLIDVSEQIKKLRSIKTSEEIKKIAYACKVTDYAFNEFLKHIHSFKTEIEGARFLEQKMAEKGCTPAFPTVVAMGKNSAIPHYNTGTDKLKRGFLLLDFGARYQNYNADMSRTIFLGKPTAEEKERYELLLKVQQQEIDSVIEGKKLGELQKETRLNLGKYSSHFIHLLGHGIGLDVHETPSFHEDGKDVVQKGQVFTIEPGIYFYKQYGIRIEDTLLFDGKVKLLTKSKKELIMVKI